MKDWLFIFFWHLAQTLKVLAKLLPAQLYNLLSTCLKGKNSEFKFLSKNFGFESFCKSSLFDGFIAKPHQFFSTNFWQCCQSCIQGVQMNNLWKNLTWEKNLFFVKTAFYLSSNFLMESNICEWIVHWLFFLDIGRKLSRFWRNCFRTVVQTAFYMSQGETLVLFNFWGENFVSESFCSFQWINGFREKPYLFFFT